MRNNKIKSLALSAMAAICLAASSCHHIDDTRIPPAAVYVPFNTIGEWNIYGVSGAGVHRRFIKADKVPDNYPYSALSATGFGGILLIGDVHGNAVAYDLACPVECRNDVRIRVTDDLKGECPKCHSTYELVTNYGYPLSGQAAERGYGLQRYYVGAGNNGEYRIISR